MTKSIFLFKINDNFSSLKKENNLDIILNIFLKTFNSNFYSEQFELIIDEIDELIIKDNLINNLKNKQNFYIFDDKLVIKNSFKESEEIIYFNNKYIKILLNDDNSLFLEYISLYFFELIAIELENEKIYPLHLVKNNILV